MLNQNWWCKFEQAYKTMRWLSDDLRQCTYNMGNMLNVKKGLIKFLCQHPNKSVWGRKFSRIGRKWTFRGMVNWSHNGCGMPKISWWKLSRAALRLRNLWRFSPLKVSRYNMCSLVLAWSVSPYGPIQGRQVLAIVFCYKCLIQLKELSTFCHTTLGIRFSTIIGNRMCMTHHSHSHLLLIENNCWEFNGQNLIINKISTVPFHRWWSILNVRGPRCRDDPRAKRACKILSHTH